MNDNRDGLTGGRGGKIFCIGAAKTGTTSLEAFFKSLGFSVGDQAAGELLLKDWAVRNFAPIVSLAGSAQVFQDMPFNCPFTFQAMDGAFPGSRFILSVRDDPQQWYASLTRFHTQLLGKGRLPTGDDLRGFPYRYPGWILEALVLVYGVSEDDPYEMDRLIDCYRRHNDNVAAYFRHRPSDLLILNLADGDAAERIISFLGLAYAGEALPHLNRST